MAKTDTISSTEKLLDLIRGKKSDEASPTPVKKPVTPGVSDLSSRFGRLLRIRRPATIGVSLGYTDLKLVKIRQASATSQELGDNISELDATVEGESIEIAFNAKYMIDILNVLDCAQVALETVAPASPGVLRPIGDDSFVHVIMPMHLTR